MNNFNLPSPREINISVVQESIHGSYSLFMNWLRLNYGLKSLEILPDESSAYHLKDELGNARSMFLSPDGTIGKISMLNKY